MKMKFSFFLVIIFLSDPCFSADEGQNIPDQIKGDSYYQETLKKVEGDNAFMPDGAKNIDISKYPDPQNNLLDDPHFYDKTFSKDAGHSLESKNNNASQILEFKDADLGKEVHHQGKTTFSFGYFFDSNNVKDPKSIYNKTYKESTGSQESGSIHLSGDRTIYRSFFDANLGGNLGLSFSQGNARFATSQALSNAKFTLWMIPIDLSAGVALPISHWAKLRLAGGPSAMVMMQTRSDKKTAEKFKRRRQIGTGYFLEGQFDFSLSSLIPSMGKQLLGEYGISQYYISAIVRAQKYSHFQDDIEVSGSSLGILMTFEYL